MRFFGRTLLAPLVIVAAISVCKAEEHIDLRVALNHEPDVLDLTITRASPASQPVLENITESLWAVGTDGEVRPGLASWEISQDATTYTFTLQTGIKFHSGDELTADDVLFSHQRELASGNRQYVVATREIDQVEIVDRYRIRFKFKRPNVTFLQSRALFIGSRAYYTRVGEQQFVAKPVGTGPYRFVAFLPGQHFDVARWDGYWGERPQIQNVRFLFVKEDVTRVSQLVAKEVDMIMNVPGAAVGDLRGRGFAISSVPVHPTASIQFQFANANAPWSNRHVRLAIAEAIDADAIVRVLLQGVPVRYARLAPNEAGYDPLLHPYRYDPEHARKLLAEAGYPNGFKMSLISWAGTYQGFKETTEAVALYLRAVGIVADVETIDGAKMLERIRTARADPNGLFIAVAALPMSNEPDPLVGLSIGYYSKSPFSLYRNPEFDKLFEAANVEPNEPRRADLISRSIRLLHDDIATIPLWTSTAVYAMRPDVEFVPTSKSLPLLFLKDVRVR